MPLHALQSALPINAKQAPYSAIGDGIVDDSTALQAAITAAASLNAELLIPAGTYKITTTLNVVSGTSIRGEGNRTILDFSSAAGAFIAMQAIGTKNAAVNLTGNAVVGDELLTVSSTGFTDGDYVKLSSTAVSGTTSIPKGEIVRINSAAGMTLYDPLADSYATVDTAQVEKLNQLTDIKIRGIHFLGPVANTQQITGLWLDTCRDVMIRDCQFERCHYNGIVIQETVLSSIIGCNFRQNTLAGLAYGISVTNSTQDLTIQGCTGARMRHLVTHGAVTARRGMPKRTVTSGCVASQMMDAGFDCHPGGMDISFIGNFVYGSEQDGIIMQGSSGTIVGNTVREITRHGIIFQPLSVNTGPVTITGNRIEDTKDRGIDVVTAAGSAPPSALTITGNTIDTTGSTGIEIGGSANAISHVSIAGNAIRNPGTHGILADTINYGAIGNNTVETATSSVTAIYCRAYVDGTVTGNAIHTLSATSTLGIRVDINALSVACSGNQVVGNRVTGAATGISIAATTTNTTVSSNNCRGCTTAYVLSTGTGNLAFSNVPGVIATVASASTVTLPASEDGVYKISGATVIDTITATDMAGRTVRLITTATAGVSDSVGNCKLSAAFTGTADDVLTLTCDGTSWFEAGRSAN